MGLGDDFMVAGHARRLQQTDPRRCRVTTQGRHARWSLVWDHNPRIARPDEAGDCQLLPARGMDNMRPYHTAKSDVRWVYNLAFRPDVGEIYLTEQERAFGSKYAGRVLIEPHIKPGASPNKQWGMERWTALVRLMRMAGIVPAQMGREDTPLVDGCEFIVTPTFRMAVGVIEHARAVVLPEGGLHHAAAALGVPGVVIFGGFTPVELTGYPMHRNLGASLDDACGMRIPCKHCAAAMAAIKPQQVFNELEVILDSIPDSGRRASSADRAAPGRHDAGAEAAHG